MKKETSLTSQAPDLEALQVRAEEVRRNLTDPQRPFFFEFAGTPKSGKSTTIGIVEHFLRRTGFNVLSPSEGASKRTPKYLKDDWVAFNTWTATYALTQVLEGMHDPGLPHISILDRGLFDSLAWFQYLSEQGTIDEQVKNRIQAFLTIENWAKQIDAVFLFTTDPETALARENSETLIKLPGRAMNADVLGKLNESYARVRISFASSFPRFHDIDTSNKHSTTPTSTSYEVVSTILDTIEAPTQ